MSANDEADVAMMDKVIVETRARVGGPVIRKSFQGQWLIKEDDKLFAERGGSGIAWDHKVVYQLAQTKKGALVVYECDPDDNEGIATMDVYDDLDTLKVATDGAYRKYPENIIAAFADALGDETHTMELDI
jgi:hypothetical protein